MKYSVRSGVLSLEPLEARCVLSAAGLSITEFMASNGSAYADGDGNYSDWIEVYNPESFSVDLSDYFLTDQDDNLTRWAFPETAIAPNEYLVVFASAPIDDQGMSIDDYVDAGGGLHTNFGLSAGGEYLALTYRDPITQTVSIVDEYDEFPEQRANVSYGRGSISDRQDFVGVGAEASSFVPEDDSLGDSWMHPGFTPDGAWTAGSTGVGFGRVVDGFAVRTYQAYTGPGSPIGGTVDNLAEVMTVIEDPAAQASYADGLYPTVNFLNTGDSGNYAGDAEFPGRPNPTNYDHIVTEAHGLISIPEPGQYTFGVYSNEGFLLEVGDFTLLRDGPGNSDDDELATFNFAESGEYEINLYHFERTGDAWIELFAAPGQHSTWNATDFDLVGDVAAGGLAVRSDAIGGSGAKVRQLLGTDLEVDMYSENPSLYARVEFNATAPELLDTLRLRMKYDDGFIAYLNGTEIARQNFTGAASWNSAADSLRAGDAFLEYQDFDVSAFTSSLVDGTNVLAVHGLNASASDPDALVLPELSGFRYANEGAAYYDEPTPGAPNGEGFYGFAADTEFSVDRGFFDEPFQVEITTDTPGAAIYYATNGDEPTASTGTLYDGPITIDRTTVLRAIAYEEGYLPTNVDTQTYFILNDIVGQDYNATLAYGFPTRWGGVSADYGLDPDVVGAFDSNGNPIGGDDYRGYYADLLDDGLLSIPTVSIVADIDDLFGPSGIYANPEARGSDWERPASVEWISPDGSEGFQVDAGLRIQGGWFRRPSASSKHSFRLLFKSDYGPTELEFPLFEGAVDSYNTVVLRAGANDGYAWSSARYTEQYIRDEFGRALQNAAGNPNAHGNFAHLYINGVYWGLYNPTERPDAAFGASYFGGDPDNWDSIHVNEVSSGDFDAWFDMLAKTAEAGSSLQAYMELQGLNTDGTPGDVAPLLNVDSYIDYIAINVWGGNWDWPWKNWWAGRDRADETTTGFEFFGWDFENTMGNNRSRSPLNAVTLNQDFTGTDNAGQAHTNLKSNPEYRMAFADHLHALFFNDGVLTPPNLITRYEELADTVELAMIGESARWGDMHHSTPLVQEDWLTERDWILNTYLPSRSDIAMNEFRAYDLYPDVVAPVFSQHGGEIGSGFELSMSAPTGTIWYTLDGSDPRQIGGRLNPNAVQYTGGAIAVSPNTTVRSRALQSGEWSALNEADFVSPAGDASGLRITELHYHPSNPELSDEDDQEFIEILNTGGSEVDLTGVQIADFASEPYTFAPGQSLAPGEYLVIARSPETFVSVYGDGVNLAAAGYSDRNLSNGGETVSLIDASGELIHTVTYTDDAPWPTSPDGDGPSLEIVDPLGDPNEPANWRASLYDGGSPGVAALSIPGDYDLNGEVDNDDLLAWRSAYGSVVPLRGAGADGNANGVVDAADYTVWRDNLGAVGLLASQVAVTVPSATAFSQVSDEEEDGSFFAVGVLNDATTKPADDSASRWLYVPAPISRQSLPELSSNKETQDLAFEQLFEESRADLLLAGRPGDSIHDDGLAADGLLTDWAYEIADDPGAPTNRDFEGEVFERIRPAFVS